MRTLLFALGLGVVVAASAPAVAQFAEQHTVTFSCSIGSPSLADAVSANAGSPVQPAAGTSCAQLINDLMNENFRLEGSFYANQTGNTPVEILIFSTKPVGSGSPAITAFPTQRAQ
jgi:hypothetical protein